MLGLVKPIRSNAPRTEHPEPEDERLGTTADVPVTWTGLANPPCKRHSYGLACTLTGPSKAFATKQ